MTGEVIIQLPGYWLYTVIWLEKSSSSYPDTSSILTFDRWSHHPATRILSLYCHMTGEVIIQLPGYSLYAVIWQEKSSFSYADTVYAVIWQEKSSSSYPDNVSMLTNDRRSHNPATQILSLCWHMTGEVIIQQPGSCLYTVNSVIEIRLLKSQDRMSKLVYF